MKKKPGFFLSVFLLFNFLSVPVFSQETNTFGSDKEVMSLGYIDHLISLHEYSQALEQLSLYIQKFPDQFDKAQKRISKILKERNSFNRQAEQLAQKMKQSAESQNLTDEQADELDTQKMDIILALEGSEQNPAQEEIDLTNDARRTVRLSYYINRSNMIVNQGTALIASGTQDSQKNYEDAFEKFKEGLTLKTNDSDVVYNGQEEIPVVYPSSLNKEVDTHIAQVKNFSQSVKSQMEVCQRAYEQYISALNQLNISEASILLKSLSQSFARLASTRNTLLREGNELKKLDEQALKLNPGLGETSYITFNRWAVSGVEGNPDSGLVGAIDSFYNTRVESMKNTACQAILKEYENISTYLKTADNLLFTVTDYSTPLSVIQDVAELAQQGKEAHSLYKNISDSPAASFAEYNKSMDFISQFSKENLKNSLNLALSVTKQNEIVAKRTVINSDFRRFGQESLASAQFYEKQIGLLQQEMDSPFVAQEKQKQLLLAQSQNLNDFSKRTTAGIQLTDAPFSWQENINLYDKILTDTKAQCISQEKNVWIALAKTYSQEADNQLSSFTLRNVEANLLLNGVEDSVSESKIVKFYPTRAAQVCTDLNNDIQREKTVLNDYKLTLENSSSAVKEETPFIAGLSNVTRVILALDELILGNNEIITSAKIKANEAKIATNEARQRFDQAIKYLNSNKYDEARTALAEADESYKKSLLLEENDSFRKEFSAKIAQTDEEITVRQNEWVITTVRSLITQAYNSYYSGDFETSKQSLDDAGEIWEKTQAQENTEIAELMVLVKEALESTGGKEIAFSDPLYKDMGAYLNNAKIHYEEGKKLYQSGKIEEGTALLIQARDETRKVQRVFPKNLYANNLNLLINKILEPSLYQSTITQKINQAKASSNSGRIIDMQTALKDLKELSSVVPDNKEVSSAIKDMENQIARVAQSEQIKKDIARSEQLTRQAQRETNITRKVALLDEALSLNRRNTLAQRLKDQAYISNTAGTTVKNFLNDADEIRYTQAERYYNDGLKDQAQNLIDDLYKRNPQVSKVIKLKRRIENM